MKKWLFLLCLCIGLTGFAQNGLPPKALKQLQGAIELYKKGHTQKALDNTRKILDEYPEVTDLWDIMAEMHMENLTRAEADFQAMMNKSFTDALKNMDKGNKKKAVSKSLMGDLQPYLNAKFGFDAFMREATLKSQSSVASMYLRKILVDKAKPDSGVGNEANRAFQQAENLFVNGAYAAAIPYYREAIQEAQGNYFSAELYLGDSYFMLEEYDSATRYFTECAGDFPQYIEPHKFLADSYSKQYEFEKAIESCIKGIAIYPDVSLFAKMGDAAKFLRKQYNLGWIPRGCYPYSTTQMQNIVVAQGFWAEYRDLSEKVWAESDSIGVITHPDRFEDETYAEVYVWKKLLEKEGGNETFAFARDMQQRGYLDCYVFISLFHYDLYPTYRHFIAHQGEKAATYLRDVVIYK